MTRDLQLTIYAIGLQNVAKRERFGIIKGTSDPYAKVNTLLENECGEVETNYLGRTETVENNLRPFWTTVFDVSYEDGSIMNLIVDVIDEMPEGKEDLMMAEGIKFDVGSCLEKSHRTQVRRADNGGCIFIRLDDKIDTGAGMLKLSLSAEGLKNVDGLLSLSDPFFELLRSVETPTGRSWHKVIRSRHRKDTLSPVWDEVSVSLDRLVQGSHEVHFRISLYDHEKSGNHKLLGSVEATVDEVIANAATFTLSFDGEVGSHGCVIVNSAEIVS